MKSFRKKPPKLLEFLLSIISKPEEHFSVVGDFEEIYNDIFEEKGVFAALCWYSWQIVKSLPMGIKHQLIWRFIMFQNYLKITFRYIQKYKGYSLINILGLTLGITSSILLLSYVNYQLSFDKFHENSI